MTNAMRKFLPFLAFLTLLILPQFASADSVLPANPQVQISIQNGPGGNANLSVNLQLLILFTVLSVAPSLLIMMTSFVRVIIVLSFLRSGLSLQQPSNQIVLSLALFITFFIMAPTFNNVKKDALDPMQAGTITTQQGLDRGLDDMKVFMLKYTRQKDLALFMSMCNPPVTASSPKDLSAAIVIPAYMLSELKTGFQMGMFVLLPFLVIDMVVASILMSMGMMMLPPPIVSLPLKVMVFVLVDGWTLVVHSIVHSFQVSRKKTSYGFHSRSHQVMPDDRPHGRRADHPDRAGDRDDGEFAADADVDPGTDAHFRAEAARLRAVPLADVAVDPRATRRTLRTDADAGRNVRPMNFSLNIITFWLLASRLTGFLVLAPGVMDLQVPKLVRVAVIVWLSLFMTPLVTAPPPIDLGWVSLAWRARLGIHVWPRPRSHHAPRARGVAGRWRAH